MLSHMYYTQKYTMLYCMYLAEVDQHIKLQIKINQEGKWKALVNKESIANWRMKVLIIMNNYYKI